MSKLTMRPTAWLDKGGRSYSFECAACRQVWTMAQNRKIPKRTLRYLTSNRFRCLECKDKPSEWPVMSTNLSDMAKATLYWEGTKGAGQ